VQYLYVHNNPLIFTDPTGQYYIKQIKEKNKDTQYLAVKESWWAVIGKSAVAAFDPTGGLGGLFVEAAEAGLGYVGGNSITQISLADITASMLVDAIQKSMGSSLEKIAPKAVPYLNALFLVKDFLLEFAAHYDIAKTDEIIFKLLDICGREIKSSDILDVVKRMNNAYQFVHDFGWYFYGKVWTQKVEAKNAFGGFYVYYNYSDTFWEMDLRISNPGLLSSSAGRIKGYKSQYFSVLFCHYQSQIVKELPKGYITFEQWANDYTDSLVDYLSNWESRLKIIKESFLAYIDQ
jgi:hypothetical protein